MNNGAFISAKFSTNQCELFRNGEGNIQLYVPTRESHEGTIELGTGSYVKAEVCAREMGFEPKWSV